jgi:hypothetical protein
MSLLRQRFKRRERLAESARRCEEYDGLAVISAIVVSSEPKSAAGALKQDISRTARNGEVGSQFDELSMIYAASSLLVDIKKHTPLVHQASLYSLLHKCD